MHLKILVILEYTTSKLEIIGQSLPSSDVVEENEFCAIVWILLTKFLCFVIFLVAIAVSAFFQ